VPFQIKGKCAYQDNRLRVISRGGQNMKKSNLGKIIDQGVVVVIALIVAAAISYTGGTVMAITHMQPFQQCDICDACDVP
jgi:hypothetical protein